MSRHSTPTSQHFTVFLETVINFRLSLSEIQILLLTLWKK